MNEDKKLMTLYIPIRIVKEIKKKSKSRDISTNKLIVEYIEKGMGDFK